MRMLAVLQRQLAFNIACIARQEPVVSARSGRRSLLIEEANVILTHNLGESLELKQAHNAEALWRYVYAGKPKPFFHPVHTPAGFCITLFEPHDHFWHRGLWFTIKFINGENFWEEGEPFGTQRLPVAPSVTPISDGVIQIAHDSVWERPDGAGIVFNERRIITHRQLEGDAYALDWSISLTAQADLVLERTPFTTWGGYGGLTLRGNRNWQQTRLLFSDGSTSDRPIGHPALWADLAGTFDGGNKVTGGIAMFDHPENLRHPQPWYGATGAGHYFNAAFLFHEPLSVAKGQTLNLKYRVLIHDGMWDHDRLQVAYEAYVVNDDTSV